MSDSGSYFNPIVIPDDEAFDLDLLELITRGGASITDPVLALFRDLPAPVLYWQPTHLPIYVRVRRDLTMTQRDFALLLLIL